MRARERSGLSTPPSRSSTSCNVPVATIDTWSARGSSVVRYGPGGEDGAARCRGPRGRVRSDRLQHLLAADPLPDRECAAGDRQRGCRDRLVRAVGDRVRWFGRVAQGDGDRGGEPHRGGRPRRRPGALPGRPRAPLRDPDEHDRRLPGRLPVAPCVPADDEREHPGRLRRRRTRRAPDRRTIAVLTARAGRAAVARLRRVDAVTLRARRRRRWPLPGQARPGAVLHGREPLPGLGPPAGTPSAGALHDDVAAGTLPDYALVTPMRATTCTGRVSARATWSPMATGGSPPGCRRSWRARTTVPDGWSS